jgi:capsular polysaccharide biosynthesis protein
VNEKEVSLSEMQEMKSPRSIATGGLLLLVGGVLAMAGILKLLERNEFKSVATVKVSPPTAVTSGAYFLLTEFQEIQSHPVLANVVASLDLKERWSKKYNHGQALRDSEIEEMIKGHLELRNIRNTQLIEIGVFDDDPFEAAQLANAIARDYREFRTEQFSLSAAVNTNAPAKFVPVVIMNSAVPQPRPVRPNRYLAGVMLGCGLFLMTVGIVGLSDREG